MRFAQEPLARWRLEPEAERLFRLHWEQFGEERERRTLEPDWPRWERLEREGAVVAFTAREGWLLRGYAVYLISTGLLWRERFAASQAIFIDPAELAGLAAVRLPRFIEFCDAGLKARGVEVAVVTMKLAHAFRPALERLGYRATELAASRVL